VINSPDNANPPADPSASPAGRFEARTGLQVTLWGSAINLALAGLKLWIGLIGNSRALVADGIHSLSDLFTDAIVLLGIRWGRMEPDEDHPYGHARIETISGFLIGLVLIVVAGGIGYKGMMAIYHRTPTFPTYATLVVAMVSIIAKEILYRYTISAGQKSKSLALIGNAWHHRSDALSSVAVFVGVAAGMMNPDWYLADAYASIVVALLVFKSGFDLSKTSYRDVIDTAPGRQVLAELETEASVIEGVREAHDILARYSGGYLLVEVHIVVDPSLTVRQGHDIAKRVELHLINQVQDVAKVIVHVDPDPKAVTD
jgi:cation diffusion facilitator family transporter